MRGPFVKAKKAWQNLLKWISKSRVTLGNERELQDSIKVLGEAVPACICSKQWKYGKVGLG